MLIVSTSEQADFFYLFLTFDASLARCHLCQLAALASDEFIGGIHIRDKLDVNRSRDIPAQQMLMRYCALPSD